MTSIDQRRPSRICGVRETCERLNISRAQFYILSKRQKIRSIKIGGKRGVPESEIERIIVEGVAA